MGHLTLIAFPTFRNLSKSLDWECLIWVVKAVFHCLQNCVVVVVVVVVVCHCVRVGLSCNNAQFLQGNTL